MNAIASFIGLLVAAGADDATLYAAAPPPGSAFVRVLQAEGKATGKVGGKDVSAIAAGEASSYFVVAQGQVNVNLGAKTHTLAAESGAYYSVAWLPPGPKVFTDTPHTSRTKALVTVYNLSDLPTVSLTTADGAVEIVGGVAPGTSARRELNALAVPLVIRSPDRVVTDLSEQVLERGAAYQVVVTGAGSAVTATWGRSQTQP